MAPTRHHSVYRTDKVKRDESCDGIVRRLYMRRVQPPAFMPVGYVCDRCGEARIEPEKLAACTLGSEG